MPALRQKLTPALPPITIPCGCLAPFGRKMNWRNSRALPLCLERPGSRKLLAAPSAQSPARAISNGGHSGKKGAGRQDCAVRRQVFWQSSGRDCTRYERIQARCPPRERASASPTTLGTATPARYCTQALFPNLASHPSVPRSSRRHGKSSPLPCCPCPARIWPSKEGKCLRTAWAAP